MRVTIDFDEKDLKPAIEEHLADPSLSVQEYIRGSMKLMAFARELTKQRGQIKYAGRDPQYLSEYTTLHPENFLKGDKDGQVDESAG